MQWGSNHKKDTAEQCCQSCREHKKTTEEALDCNGEGCRFVCSEASFPRLYHATLERCAAKEDRPSGIVMCQRKEDSCMRGDRSKVEALRCLHSWRLARLCKQSRACSLGVVWGPGKMRQPVQGMLVKTPGGACFPSKCISTRLSCNEIIRSTHEPLAECAHNCFPWTS